MINLHHQVSVQAFSRDDILPQTCCSGLCENTRSVQLVSWCCCECLCIPVCQAFHHKHTTSRANVRFLSICLISTNHHDLFAVTKVSCFSWLPSFDAIIGWVILCSSHIVKFLFLTINCFGCVTPVFPKRSAATSGVASFGPCAAWDPSKANQTNIHNLIENRIMLMLPTWSIFLTKIPRASDCITFVRYENFVASALHILCHLHVDLMLLGKPRQSIRKKEKETIILKLALLFVFAILFLCENRVCSNYKLFHYV